MKAAGLPIATPAVLLLLLAAQAEAYTLQSQIDALNAFKGLMENRGPHWKGAFETWTCPTPPATSNGSCDPCGAAQWWGNWDYVGCRGFTPKAQDVLGGNGYVTNIHFTNNGVEGPTLPIQQLCDAGLTYVKEMDIDGNFNSTPPVGGTIPEVYSTCFPYLANSKLSFQKLTGTVPAFLGNMKQLAELKIRANLFTGTLPNNLGLLPNLYYLDLAQNNLSGSIPPSFRNSQTLNAITLANNNFSGSLYNMPKSSLELVETANNPLLCGMVPASVRWGSGFNPSNTGLGQPCPGETYPINFPADF